MGAHEKGVKKKHPTIKTRYVEDPPGGREKYFPQLTRTINPPMTKQITVFRESRVHAGGDLRGRLHDKPHQ